MKKKIASKENLKSMALETGAMVTDSTGKKFNAGKKTAVKKPVIEEEEVKPVETLEKPVLKKAEPKQPPKPTGPDAGSKLVAETMVSMSRANVLMLAELKSQIAAIQFNAAQPITDWEFDFIRDDKGYLVKLTASAKTEKRIIN